MRASSSIFISLLAFFLFKTGVCEAQEDIGTTSENTPDGSAPEDRAPDEEASTDGDTADTGEPQTPEPPKIDGNIPAQIEAQEQQEVTEDPASLHFETLSEEEKIQKASSYGDSESMEYYGEVVVTGDRIPVYLKDTPEIITVITADEIEKLHAKSTGEILEQIPGINIESGTGSGLVKRSVANINGFPPQYSLVLLNGARILSDHIHTGQNIDLIPPESIERIEIIRTAASAQYGSDAIGGIINIITKSSTERTKAKIYSSYGSYKTFNAGVGINTPLSDKLQLKAFVDYERTDGQPILLPQHRKGYMGYYKLSLLNSLDVELHPKVSAEVHMNYFENMMDDARDEVDEKTFSRLIMPKGALHVNFTKDLTWTSSLNWSSWRAEKSNETNRFLQPQTYITWYGFQRKNQLTVGGDYSYSWFGRQALDEVKTQGTVGVFAHDRFILNDQWVFSGSLRLDKPDGIDPVFSPKVAAMYTPLKQLRIRGSIGRAFHAPTVQELYEEGYGHSAALRFGNPDLKPEYGTTFSLSFEILPVENLQIFVNGYFSMVDNFISLQYEGQWEEDPTMDVWRRKNILQAKIFGGDASVKWGVLKWWDLQIGYSYNDNIDESDNKQLAFRPGQSVFAKTDLHYSFSRDYAFAMFVKFSGHYGRSFWSWKPAEGADRSNEDGYVLDLENYELLDAGAEFVYKETFKLFANVSNILGKDIEKLDDALTKIDGEPVFFAGLKIQL